MKHLRKFLGCVAAIAGLGLGSVEAASAMPAEDRSTVLLAINDVYRIEGPDGRINGGLARVRALRKELEREAPGLLMLHGGDFLFPSFASRMYRGEQMVSILNTLDGDPLAFDPRMFVVFGNHEFDRPKLKDAALLRERIDQSQFRWLGGNVLFAQGSDGASLVASKNLSRTAVIDSGGIRIGLFGLTIPTVGVEYVSDFAGEEATARELIAALKAMKAEVIVAVTHLNAANDRRLLESLGDAGLDLVIGGHDHDSMQIQVKGRFILKADADARTATVVRLTVKKNGLVVVKPQLRVLSGVQPSQDPQVNALVNQWQARHEREFCASSKAGPECLEEVYGRTRSELGGEETKIRARETSLGSWITDRMIDAFKSCGAQMAFVNSGSLRINSDLPKGTTITRRHLEELFAYPAPLYLLRIDGQTLAKVADHATRGWPGSGTWLQIGGFAFKHDTKARTASDLTSISTTSSRRVLPGESILAVTSDFLINPDADQDGYLMLNKGPVVECAANGTELKALVIRALLAAEPAGIAPRVEGRICQGAPRAPCLAAKR